MTTRSLALAALGCCALLAGCGGGGGGGQAAAPVPPVAGNAPTPSPSSAPATGTPTAIPTASPTATPTTRPATLSASPPPSGAYLGAFVGAGAAGTSGEASAMAGFESGLSAVSGVRHPLAVHLHFRTGKPGDPRSIATVATDPAIADDYANGRVPIITWTCADKLSTIASGADDATLIAPAAAAIKALPGPVYLRFFHEFELNLTDGLNAGGTATTNGQYQYCFDAYDPNKTLAQNLPAEAAEFIAAWQHIHAVFASAGVTNVAWLWNPGGSPGAVANDNLMSFFPGTANVDWIGGDFYDKPEGACGGQGAVALLTPFYTMAHNAQPGVPIMMTETGEDTSHGGCSGGPNWTQAQYMTDLATNLPTRFPQIKAVAYFDATGNAPFDWTLAPGSAGFTAFAQLEKNGYFVLSAR